MLSELSEDQREIQKLVRTVLEKQPVGGASGRPLTDEARAVWSTLAGELGVGALVVPERYDGLGLGFAELSTVLTECGRVLTPAPVLSTGLTALAIGASPSDAVREKWLPQFASGAVGAVALAEDNDEWFAPEPATTASKTNGAWRVSGTRSFVIDAELADVIVVPARTGEGTGLFLVPTNQMVVEIVPMRTMDLSRGQAIVRFDEAAADRLDAPGEGSALERLRRRALLALASEQLGTAERALEMAVDYARERYQFGRPIGSFQAIKHRCADMLVDVERMRSMVQHGVWAIEHDVAEVATIASSAQAICSEGVVSTTLGAVQVHGGIGFTWEHDLHRYVRRAKSTEAYLGLPAIHRERVADGIVTVVAG